MSNYKKPSVETIRRVMNSFGSTPAKKMIEIRQRAMKITMMDYAVWCMRTQGMSAADTKKVVFTAIDKAIDSGVSTPKLKETLDKFINKKARTIDPIMRLHCAITMETMGVMSNANDPDPTSLPIDEGKECGANCFSNNDPASAVENLALHTTDAQMKLYSAVGGSLADQMFRTLGTALDPKYVTSR